MSSSPKPSFHETPSKTTIFVVEFREKTGVSAFLEVQNLFRGKNQGFDDLFSDLKKATDK